jgi:integrase
MAKRLTEKAIQRMSASKQRDVSDGGAIGLSLRITMAGRKIWRYRYQLRGKTRIMTLGDWPEFSLTDARAQANAFRSAVVKGDDPAAIAQKAQAARRAMPTVEAFASEFVEFRKAAGIKSWRAEELILEKWMIPEIGCLRLNEVMKRDILRIRNQAKKKGLTRQPGKIVAVASIFFSTAEEEFGLIDGNPCARMKREQPEPKQRFLTDGEIRTWWEKTGDAIKSDNPEMPKPVALALRVLLLTGQRPGEVAGMTRSELRLDAPEGPYWFMPPERRVKGRNRKGMAHAVALVPEAVDTIEKALKLSNSEYVFEKQSGGPLYDGLGRVVVQMFDGADDRPTPHAARRTVVTKLVSMSFDEFRVSRVTGHAFKGTTGTTYTNHDVVVVAEDVLKAQRHLLTVWADRLNGIIKGESSSAKVVQMKARA